MSSEGGAFIPNCVPDVGEGELAYLTETIRAGWVGSGGPVYDRFVESFAAYVGASTCLPVATGTAAIQLALRVLGVGPGDSVFVPSLTFVATATPAAMLGARVVPVDVEPATWTIDAADLARAVAEERAAGREPKVCIPVHLYSMPADIEAVSAVASAEGLAVVEDAAEGLATFVDGRHVGLEGEIGCFSFNANKLVTAGGGGMIVARDPAKLDEMRHLAAQARSDRVDYVHDAVGYNYRFSALHAAVGLAQLEKVGRTVARKHEIRARYREVLGSRLSFVDAPEGVACGHWLATALLPAESRWTGSGLARAAIERGVELRPWFTPLHSQESWPDRSCPRSEEAWRRGVLLPSSPGLSDAELARVAALVAELCSDRC